MKQSHDHATSAFCASVLGAEAQPSDEVGGEAEDEAAHGSEEWVVARLLASLSEHIVNIS